MFLTHRVAVLEKDLVKLQGMWDMNKGQRVIEVWMSILNRKSYKPSDMYVYSCSLVSGSQEIFPRILGSSATDPDKLF